MTESAILQLSNLPVNESAAQRRAILVDLLAGALVRWKAATSPVTTEVVGENHVDSDAPAGLHVSVGANPFAAMDIGVPTAGAKTRTGERTA